MTFEEALDIVYNGDASVTERSDRLDLKCRYRDAVRTHIDLLLLSIAKAQSTTYPVVDMYKELRTIDTELLLEVIRERLSSLRPQD